MIRYLITLVGFLFGLAVYYRAVAPGIETLLNELRAAFSAGGPLEATLFGDISQALFIWIPLIALAGVLLMGYLIAVGPRGTSFRP